MGKQSLDEGFPQMNSKASKLIPIIEKYALRDIAIAIFAINSWRDNRSAQENSLALNLALIKNEKFGAQTIRSYSDFLGFYNSISELLKVSSMDDAVLNDFGEIKLCYCNHFYSVITGTGHTSPVFAVLQFLEEISNALGNQQQTINLLTYSEKAIEFLGPTNITTKEGIPIVFECPSENYFSTVKKFFDDEVWNSLDEVLIKMFSSTNAPTVKKHFIIKDKHVYPLFNPSLVIDYYTTLISHAPADLRNSCVTRSLMNKCKEIHLSQGIPSDTICKNYRICESRIPHRDNIPGFIVSSGKTVIFFIDSSNITFADVNSIIENITEIYDKGKLGIVDLDVSMGFGKFRGFDVSKQNEIHFVLYNDFTNIDETHITLGKTNERDVYTAVDLMYILMSVDSINQLLEFDQYSSSQTSNIFSWGGKSDYFSLWKHEQGYIAKGAIEFNNIYSGIDISASEIYEKYIKLKNCFPFHLAGLPLGYPEEWTIVLDDNRIYQFSKKSKDFVSGSIFILENGCTIFLACNFAKILIGQNIQEIKQYRDFIIGIFERFMVEFSHYISDIQILSNYFIQLECESLTTVLSDKYSEILNYKSTNNSLFASYVIDSRKVMRSISDCIDRSAEYGMVLQVITPLIGNNTSVFSAMLKAVSESTTKKKTVNATSKLLDYYYNTNSLNLRLTDAALLFARKEIAIIAADNGIMPGKYVNKEATHVVRKMQQALVTHFEEIVSNFDQISLHTILLSYYSCELFSAYVNSEGYRLTNEIDALEKESSKNKLFHLSEESKQMQLALLYLIETNLFLTTGRKNNPVKESDIEKLFAFSYWLVILQNNSDLCFHTDSQTQFVILDDYRVDVELGQTYADKFDSTRRRFYDNNIYSVMHTEEDKRYFEKIASGFEIDTGIKFQVFESIMRQLYECSFQKGKTNFSEISPNVFQINKADLIENYTTYVVEKVDRAMIQKAYGFLTIIPEMLKNIGDRRYPILPVWEREKRDNRFSVRPLLEVGDSYIYSPIMIKELYNRWINGLQQFYPPYEIGLNHMLKSLWDWKEHYEHLLAFDVRDLLLGKGFVYAEANVDLRRKDRAGNHPPIHELGDYDVIALDTMAKRVLIIECKVLRPIGSIFEHSMEQNRFFSKEKFDEKFQKRIDYMAKVYRSFFKNIGYDLSDDIYLLQSYMVVNKVFESYYKPVAFPIVTLDELTKIIDAESISR